MPLTSLVIAALLATAAAAQDLQARVLAAAQLPGSEGDAALQALGLEHTPVKELVGLFAGESPLLEPDAWRRLAPRVHARTTELMQLWWQEREMRRAAAQLFARLDVDWVALAVPADPDERADIEALAAWLPFRMARAEQMFSHRPFVRSSATHLQGLASRAGLQWAETHRADVGVMAASWRAFGDDAEDPFGLAAGMTSADPSVRGATALFTRRMLGLEAPRSVYSAICMHADPALRDLARGATPSDAQLEQYVTVVAAGAATYLVEFPDLGGLSLAARRGAALRLLELAHTTPPPDPATWKSGYERVGELFCDAVRLDPDAWADVVTSIVETDQEHVREGAMECLSALGAACSRRAELQERLLRRFEDIPKESRCDVLYWLDATIDFAEHEVLRDLYLQLALRSLTGEHRPRLFPQIWGCGNVPLGPDIDLGSQLVSAARLGLIELLDPTLERLAAAELTNDTEHLSCLWEVLTLLGPFANVDQAARLLTEIEGAGGGTAAAQSVRQGWRAAIAIAIYGVVPEGMLPRVDALLPERLRYEDALPAMLSAMPTARYRRLLRRLDGKALTVGLLAPCPDLLAAAWRSSPVAGQRAMMRELRGLPDATLTDLIEHAEELPLALVEAVGQRLREWPRACPPLTLDRIIRLHALGLRGSTIAVMLETCVLSPSQGQTLLSLTDWLDPWGKLAVVRRLHALGDEWHDAARAVLDQVLACADVGPVRQALVVAADLDLRDCEWRAAADRVDALSGDVARVRLGGARILQCGSDPVRLLFALKAAGWREDLAQIDGDLWPLIWGNDDQDAETVVAELSSLAQQPEWSQQLHVATARRTTDERAAVRRAAYLALATRDRSRWPTAWLVYEAALDHDPSVREVAPK